MYAYIKIREDPAIRYESVLSSHRPPKASACLVGVNYGRILLRYNDLSQSARLSRLSELGQIAPKVA